MATKVKVAPAWIKAAGEQNGLAPGQFEAIVSVFGNIDAYGDVMQPGSFRQTISDWAAKGEDPVPVIWSHDWMIPASHIGYLLDWREVPAAEFSAKSPAGLWVRGQLDHDANPAMSYAPQVNRLMLGRRVTQFSFAYDEIKGGPITHEGQDAWGVEEVAVHEVGPTLLGANRDTDLLAAKRTILDLGAKVGARHSADDAKTLGEIHAGLVKLGVCSDPEGKSHQPGTATEPPAVDGPKAEDGQPAGATPEEPVKSLADVSSMELDLLLLEFVNEE